MTQLASCQPRFCHFQHCHISASKHNPGQSTQAAGSLSSKSRSAALLPRRPPIVPSHVPLPAHLFADVILKIEVCRGISLRTVLLLQGGDGGSTWFGRCAAPPPAAALVSPPNSGNRLPGKHRLPVGVGEGLVQLLAAVASSLPDDHARPACGGCRPPVPPVQRGTYALRRLPAQPNSMHDTNGHHLAAIRLEQAGHASQELPLLLSARPLTDGRAIAAKHESAGQSCGPARSTGQQSAIGAGCSKTTPLFSLRRINAKAKLNVSR